MQSSPGFPNDDIDISPKYETLLQIINHLMRDQDVYDTNQKGRKNTSNHHDKSHREFEEVPPSFVLLAQAVEVKESSDKDGPTDNLVEHHRPSLALGLDENRQVNEGQDVEGSMLPNSQRTRMQTSNNIRDQSEGNAPQDEFNDLNDLALTSISVEKKLRMISRSNPSQKTPVTSLSAESPSIQKKVCPNSQMTLYATSTRWMGEYWSE